jgi:glycolate oxidase iron-sulfur subunit
MQTELAEFIRDTPDGREAESILRKCVHCGFCTATCPTYQLLGDELDGPRGRIYLIKQLLETGEASAKTQLHLDRCLTCRSCETTCPSGVQYARLLDIGRHVVERRVGRTAPEALKRAALRRGLTSGGLFSTALGVGRMVKGLLPGVLADKVPAARPAGARPRFDARRHPRRLLLLDGCVQPALAPSIDAAMARVLDRIGIGLVVAPRSGCCGAVSQHLDAPDEALDYVRRNVDAWWPEIERGAEAVVVTASGCGAMVKEYGHLLRNDPAYAEKAARVAALARDTAEVIAAEWEAIAARLVRNPTTRVARVAFHSPCTLQHGMRIRGVVEKLLGQAGCELTPVPDAHLCCGSAGTYSILQPELSERLKAAKLEALESGSPDEIATANIGCLTHLQTGTRRPVRHWIELLDERMR